jgi:hypothetical protein
MQRKTTPSLENMALMKESLKIMKKTCTILEKQKINGVLAAQKMIS